jgi:hypothetical protein
MVTLQSKRDKKRYIELTQESWGKMVELGLHKNWKVVSKDAVSMLDSALSKEVTGTLGEFIASKKSLAEKTNKITKQTKTK